MSGDVYRIGDRCPKCGQHFRELVQNRPADEEFAAYGVILAYPDESPTEIVCPNAHRYEPHPEWLQAPYPTPVFAP